MPQTNPIIKKTEKTVANTIRRFSLFTKKDKILVACSGGKDSTAALYILKKLGYPVEAITVDALIGNYTKKNIENIKNFCKQHSIPLHIISKLLNPYHRNTRKLSATMKQLFE